MQNRQKCLLQFYLSESLLLVRIVEMLPKKVLLMKTQQYISCIVLLFSEDCYITDLS